MDNFSIKDKIIILTGSSGQLGSDYAKYLTGQGAIVVGLDLQPSDDLTFLERFYFINTDITCKNSLTNACNVVLEKFNKIDGVINNAAIDSPPKKSLATVKFENLSEEIWDQTLDVNLKGIFLTCQTFGPHMVKNKSGSIINIGSIYGMVSPDQSIYEYKRLNQEDFFKPITYSVSKGGIYNLTRYLATYWAYARVRVNTLTIAGVFNNQEIQFLSAYEKRIPIGKMAKSNDYTGAIQFLLSDASSYMTGSNMVVDGGWTSI